MRFLSRNTNNMKYKVRYIINPTKQRAAGEKKKPTINKIPTYVLFFSFVFVETRALNSYLFPFVSDTLQFKIIIQ